MVAAVGAWLVLQTREEVADEIRAVFRATREAGSYEFTQNYTNSPDANPSIWFTRRHGTYERPGRLRFTFYPAAIWLGEDAREVLLAGQEAWEKPGAGPWQRAPHPYSLLDYLPGGFEDPLEDRARDEMLARADEIRRGEPEVHSSGDRYDTYTVVLRGETIAALIFEVTGSEPPAPFDPDRTTYEATLGVEPENRRLRFFRVCLRVGDEETREATILKRHGEVHVEVPAELRGQVPMPD